MAIQQSNSSKGTNSKPNYYCSICKVDGHSNSRCYTKIAYPSWWKQNTGSNESCRGSSSRDGRGAGPSASPAHSNDDVVPTPDSQSSSSLTPTQIQQLLSLIQNGNNRPLANFAGTSLRCFSSFKPCTSVCILGSSASHHMVSDHTLFQSNTKVSTFVKLPDNKLVSDHHIGSICLQSGLVIQNVIHVHSFQFNLLSISKLSKDTNSWITFTPTSCFLQDQRTKRITVMGEQHRGLYTMDNPSTNFIHIALFSSNFDLWHWRLGHPAPTLSPQFTYLDTSM